MALPPVRYRGLHLLSSRSKPRAKFPLGYPDNLSRQLLSPRPRRRNSNIYNPSRLLSRNCSNKHSSSYRPNKVPTTHMHNRSIAS